LNYPRTLSGVCPPAVTGSLLNGSGLQSIVVQLRTEAEALVNEQSTNDVSQSEYQQICRELLELIVGHILADVRTAHHGHYNAIFSRFLLATFSTLFAELELVKQQCRRFCYPMASVNSFRFVRSQLEESIATAETQLLQIECKIREYELLSKPVGAGQSAGLASARKEMQFVDLAFEYARLTEEIKEKTWALHEMQCSKIGAGAT